MRVRRVYHGSKVTLFFHGKDDYLGSAAGESAVADRLEADRADPSGSARTRERPHRTARDRSSIEEAEFPTLRFGSRICRIAAIRCAVSRVFPADGRIFVCFTAIAVCRELSIDRS
jgi:hypothetical protein